MTTLWLVLTVPEEYADGDDPISVQGVFTSEAAAAGVATGLCDVIGPVELDAPLKPSGEWTGAYYPALQDAQTAEVTQ